MNHESQILQAALRWHEEAARDECDWDGFTAWLEESPAHAQAFDDVALLEDQLARGRAVLRAAAEPAPRRRRPLWLAAAAAALVAVAFAWSWLGTPFAGFTGTPVQDFQADASQARRLQLDDGSTILLAPGSSLRIAGRRQDRMDLEGSAYFDVPHDPRRTLVVTAGGYSIRDIGTRFEVVSGGGELKVSVAEGMVAVDLPGQAGSAQVRAGQRLLVGGANPVPEYASIDTGDVASWRDGWLSFSNEPLSLIVQQVARHAGVGISIDPDIADRRYTLAMPIGDGSQLVEQLGVIAGLVSTRDGESVRLSARAAQP
jgi:transmembrane sensor